MIICFMLNFYYNFSIDHFVDGSDGSEGRRQLLHRLDREGERQQCQAHRPRQADRHEGKACRLTFCKSSFNDKNLHFYQIVG
jgi:hypothetical protein